MTGSGPSSEQAAAPAEQAPPAASAIERANRMNAANMLRSLLPLVVICLLVVGWQAFRSSGDVGVRTIDPSSTVQLAAARAGYDILVPTGLDEDRYRPTSARTDAGAAAEGDPVTLEIGYLTPSEEFAGFVVSDDRRADPVTAVLDGAQEQGAVDIGSRQWSRSTTVDDETALSWEAGGVIVLVTGSASEEELEAVAASVEPYEP